MQSTTHKELEWIHDCVVLNISYDTSSEAGRSIKLSLRCPTDLGYAPWEGKNLVLVAVDVAMSKHFVVGVGGDETLDAVRPGISPAFQESTPEARRLGWRIPSLEFSISFHSGSELQVICLDLQVGVES